MISSAQSWFKAHSEKFGGQLLFDEPLSKHTYYRIGGPASIVAVPKSEPDLHWLAEGIETTQIPFLILGAGSNVLAADQGYSGLIIKATRLNLEMTQHNDRIRVGGSVAISSLLRKAAQEGWGGLEFLTGIPGTAGGAVRMNAGTHLGETCDKLKRVEAFLFSSREGAPLIFEGSALRFEYRRNLFLPSDALVLATEWSFTPEPPAQVKALIDETLQRRKATQPIDFPSCGSVFKNPKSSGLSAWQVVDKLGLRGHRIGDAQISEKHSNFILNLGSAKASDVQALIDLVKKRATFELSIPLEEEVIRISDPS